MSVTLVTGGTGHLGRDLVPALVARGHDVRLLSSRPSGDPTVQWAQGDLATGEGLVAALEGVDCVVHAATLSPIARRGLRLKDLFHTPQSVDVDGTRRLLAAAEHARVDHFLFVSIVGLERSPLPYARAKLTGEQLVRQSALPWSVVRACPFYYLLAQTFGAMRRLPVWPLPNPATNPVDTRDVAAHLCDCLEDGGRGIRPEIGGPETLRLAEFARQWRDLQRQRRPILPIRVSARIGAAMGFNVSEGVLGTRRWRDWLRDQAARDVAQG